jgi:hypothetical protein
MKRLPLLIEDPPRLTDETAAEMLEFLYLQAHAFEMHYGAQLRRYYQRNEVQQPYPIEDTDDFDDELPTF